MTPQEIRDRLRTAVRNLPPDKKRKLVAGIRKAVAGKTLNAGERRRATEAICRLESEIAIDEARDKV